MRACVRGCIINLSAALILLGQEARAHGGGSTKPEAHAASVKAESLQLASDPEWLRLLFMRDLVFGARRSLVSGPRFFAAADGREDADHELTADLEAFYRDPSALPNVDTHAQCLYPARLNWLKEKLGNALQNLPKVACHEYVKWQERVAIDHVAIVFSSYFANNPASMFGHSFLVLRRKAGPLYHALLDESVSYVAFPDTENPLFYSLKGLTGQFPGRLLMQPYYIKVQEYNNADSRDLWEYELSLNPTQLLRLMDVLWELGPNDIPYYYFDQNCSAIMQLILAAALPENDLEFSHPWVIPSDTLRSMQRQPGLVGRVIYRPSSLSAFLHSYRSLDAAEQHLVDHIVADNQSAQALLELRPLDLKSKAAIIDAVLDCIDFKERIAGSKDPVTYAALRSALLIDRSKLPTRAVGALAQSHEVSRTEPLEQRPDASAPSARISVGAGTSSGQGGFAAAEWRPALHDLASPDEGFPPGLAIEFFGLTVRAYPDHPPVLQNFNLIAIHSVPSIEAIVRPRAWSFEIGSQALDSCGKDDFNCRQSYLRGGRGLSGRLGPGVAYALLGAQSGYQGGAKPAGFAGPYITAGSIFKLSRRLKLNIEGVLSRQFSPQGHSQDRDELSSVLAWAPSLDKEWRWSVTGRRQGTEWVFLYSQYY